MNHKEYLQWCKDRALEYVEADDVLQAWLSMVSDLQKNEDTRDHPGIDLGMMLLISGGLFTKREMRDFIEGFN